MSSTRTQQGFDRIVFFSDATVAIALTLLVLPLADLASTADRVPAGTLIHEHFPAIAAFVVSFVVIAVIWLEHHRLFESLAGYDTALVLINFVWLLAIVGLPFSTEVNQEAPREDRGGLALYIGNLLLAFVTIALMRLIAMRDPRLIEPAARPEFDFASSVALVILCAVALILAVSVPAIGVWALLLLGLTGRLTRLLRHASRNR